MDSFAIEEIKAFVPAKDYNLSIQFYQDLGFILASNENGIAYFHCDGCSFLLQDFYIKEHADNFMMHILVKNVDSWWAKVEDADLINKYHIRSEAPSIKPWGMKDFVLIDPSGVLWRIGENIDQ